MRLYNKPKMLTLLLAFFICCAQLVYAQPSFVSPVTCINANPATSTQAYTINANGTTITSIALLGDLELVSISPALPTTSNVTVTVKSKNVGRDTLNDCVGYLSSRVPNAKNFGFGKGVIRVSYSTGAGCGNWIDQNIFKLFSETPPIVGPKCVAPGDTVTFSVCSILSVNQNANIGIDAYTWNQRAGLGSPPINGLIPVYTSGDNSSVTFVVSTATTGTGYNGVFTGGTLTCKFGTCNSGTASLVLGIKTKQSTVTIGGSGAVPNSSTCISTATTPITLVATAPAGYTGIYSYSWSTSNSSWGFGGTNTATTTSASGGSVSLNVNESSGAIYLTTVGGCNPRTDTFFVKRGLIAPLVIKRTDAAACITPGTNITFYINNASNNANLSGLTFTWNLPPGWTPNPASTGPTITATAGAAGGSVGVSANGCAGTLNLPVNVTPAQPSVISGNACITPGTPATQAYSVTQVGTLTYNWFLNPAVSTGWSVNSTSGSGITYNVASNAISTIVNVTATSTISGAGSCVSTPRALTILLNPTTPTGVTVTSVCGVLTNCIPGGLVTNPVVLTASGGQGVYNWIIPAGFGSLISTSGNTATVSCLGTPGLYQIGVYCTNGSCPQSGTSNTMIQVQPAATLTYTPNPSPPYDLLSVNLNGGCTPSAYCWKQNNTGACLYSTQSILLQNGGPTSYTVTISYGTCSRQITQATRFTSRPVAGTVKPLSLKEAAINPNPAADNFTLLLPEKSVKVSVSIYSSKGLLMKQQVCKGGSNSFSTENWSSGEYLVKITGSKGEIVTKKLIINK